MVDKNKIIQAATKFVQKGQFDKAIREYQRIIEEDPKDIRILLKVGELYQKRGDNRDAAATLLKVADSYASDGFFLKAAAVYKQVLKLNPSLLDVNVRLAELYQQLGLMSDAMQQFQLVAATYEKQGNAQAVLAILKKLVELEPDNAASRVRLAEAYSAENMTAEAIAELTKVATQLRQNSRTEEYAKVAERLIFLDPANITLTRELANVYLARGDPKRALTKLQTCFKEDPRNIDTLILLAQAFLDLGQKVKTVSVYKELAKIYADSGRTSEEEATWRRVIALLPEDPEAKAALRAGTAVTRDEEPEAIEDRVEAGPRRERPAPVEAVTSRAPVPRRAQEPGIQRLLTETDVYLKYGLHEKAAEHLKKILAAAPQSVAAHEKAKDLYLAMGDTRRAADELATCAGLAVAAGNLSVGKVYLDQLIEVAPDHAQVVPLGNKLANVAAVPEVIEDAILLDAGEPTEPGGRGYDAVGAFVQAAAGDREEPMEGPRLAADDDILISTATGEVRVLATLEDDAVLVPELVDAPSSLETDLTEGSEVDDLALTAAAGSMHEEIVEEPSEELLVSRPPSPRNIADSPPVPSPNAPPVRRPVSTPAPVRPATRIPSPQPSSGAARPPESAPARPSPRFPSRPIEPARAPPAPAPVSASVPRPAPVGAQGNGVSVRRPSGVIDVPPVLARGKPVATSSGVAAPKPRDEAAAEFAEAEFFIEQGLFDDAREAIAALRGRVASRPELSPRLEALLRRLPRAEPENQESSGLVDIGSEIAAEVSSSEAEAQDEFQYSVQDVLQEFKKGVEKAVRPEDVETHYELGIAYKEMGLTEEAIGEFEVALRGAAGKPKEPDCLAMIGICYSANGSYAKAVGYFERALSSRAIRAETKLNLQYEIGAAREAAGDLRAALDAYEQVAKVDASYREVGKALARLRAARGASNGSPQPQLENLVRTEGKAPLAGEPDGSKVRKVGYL
jgi:tetratricopeptide (TPR) repeat protein